MLRLVAARRRTTPPISFLIVRSAHQRSAARKPKPKTPPSTPPPTPPNPPKKPERTTLHGETWEDPYSWMSKLTDKVAMRHMDMYMEQEEKYTEAVMSETERLQSKLLSEMASRLAPDLSTPPLKWGTWLYYRRVEEGKQFPVLCRRLASLNEEFISNKLPSAGFDFASGKKIEQVLVDYNKEAERLGGFAYEEVSEVSPDHHYIAYTMYDKENDFFKLCVRDLNTRSLCDRPQADRVTNVAWAKNGKALLYVVTDQHKRPCKVYCSLLGAPGDDVLLLDEPKDNAYINIRHTKDFRFVAIHKFSTTSSKVFLLDSADPLSGMRLVWEGEAFVHCIVEHHRGYLFLFTDAAKEGQLADNHCLLRSPVGDNSGQRKWEHVFVDDPEQIIQDVDLCDSHLVLGMRMRKRLQLCAVPLPLPDQKEPLRLEELSPCLLPLPQHVSEISSGPNYDYLSSTMRFTISSPVMPDAVVEYDLSTGKWTIVQQQNLLHDRTRILYGKASSSIIIDNSERARSSVSSNGEGCELGGNWNDLSEFYACEYYDVSSHDGVMVPLTIVYSNRSGKGDQSPALLHGHGAYGELLDKRWRSDLKSLLDRGWVIAYADVRGGGGRGKKWHHDGRRSRKYNSVQDFISCAKFLANEKIIHEEKLAAWGYSAGGLLVASAINFCPHLFRAAVLKVPFLDPTNTLLHPILPLLPVDYEEFGYPQDFEDFQALRKFSPYDNIQQDVLYPAVLVSSSFSTRFGVWEAAKWAARVRERTIYDPKRPILLNLVTDLVHENRYLQCKELAMETAFLLKMVES
ncbi:hypothetical protein Droror1_Dr00009103 [Drosera rotundifolia]